MLEDVGKDLLWYLATPYSSEDPLEVESRYLGALYLDSILMQNGYKVISPIAMSHQQAQRFKLPTDWEFFKNRDLHFVSVCDGVIIGTLDGWDASIGVTAEVKHAWEQDKPVYYFDGEDLLPMSHSDFERLYNCLIVSPTSDPIQEK